MIANERLAAHRRWTAGTIGEDTEVITITVTGAECTGKTTLARELSARYGVPWVPEAARLFVEQEGRAVRRGDVETIARMHVEMVGRTADSDVLFLDTDLFSTVAYARHYFGSCPRTVLDLARRRVADLYLVAAADLPWEREADQRGTEGGRDAVQRRLDRLVRASGRPRSDISGHGPARLDAAIRAVDAFLPEVPVRNPRPTGSGPTFRRA